MKNDTCFSKNIYKICNFYIFLSINFKAEPLVVLYFVKEYRNGFCRLVLRRPAKGLVSNWTHSKTSPEDTVHH